MERASAHFLTRRQLLQGALAAAASFGALACSGERPGGGPRPLQVGGLPVTCNLRLPVACVAKAASNDVAQPGAPRFEYEFSKYNGWPEIKESLMTGGIQAGYMLAPLVMDLADKRIPVQDRLARPPVRRRDHGADRVALPPSPAARRAADRDPEPLRRPFLFLRKMLAQEGMTQDEIKIVEMPPPDMPAALYADAVDAYCTGRCCIPYRVPQ